MPEPKSPYKRVRRNFSQVALKRVCEMHEFEFADAYGMEVVQLEEPGPDNFYFYKDNGSNILAVAHLDTVSPHAQRTANFVNTAGGTVVYSRALDDRLGAYTILELLPKLGINYDILLTVGEETGNTTAQHFRTEKEYNWMIEFDRGGTDVVMYQYEDRETRDLVKATGAKVGNGIFSDISYMDHLEIKGFNWGVGYQDYHYPRAHAYLEDYWMMIGHYLKFHEANAEIYLPHENTQPSWFGSYGFGHGYRSTSTSRHTDEWWEDTVSGEIEEHGTGVAAWSNDSNWGEKEWDAYIEGGIDAVRKMYEDGTATALLDDDGDLISDDFDTVNRQITA